MACFLLDLTFQEWLDILQFLATAFLGIAAYFIARRQYQTAHNKLRLDLFEKRYSIYETLIAYLRQATNDPISMNNATPIERNFFSKKSEALFLMPTTVAYLEEVRMKAAKLHAVNVKMNANQAHPKYPEWVDEDQELSNWLSNQFSESETQFRAYLEFPEKRI